MKQGKLIVISGPSGVGKSSVIGEILKRHPEEVNVELTVQIVEFIITLSIWRIRIHFFQVVFVEGTVFIDTLPDNKKLPVLHRDQSTATEWTSKFEGFVETIFLRREE